MAVYFTKGSGTTVMTKQPTALTFDGDRIASGFHNVFTNSAGLNNLLNTQHTDIIITHHSSCPQRRVLVIITIDTNITTMSTNELTQAVHR